MLSGDVVEPHTSGHLRAAENLQCTHMGAQVSERECWLAALLPGAIWLCADVCWTQLRGDASASMTTLSFLPQIPRAQKRWQVEAWLLMALCVRLCAGGGDGHRPGGAGDADVRAALPQLLQQGHAAVPLRDPQHEQGAMSTRESVVSAPPSEWCSLQWHAAAMQRVMLCVLLCLPDRGSVVLRVGLLAKADSLARRNVGYASSA